MNGRAVVMTVVFVALILGIFGGIHYALWARLVRDPMLPGAWRKGLTWVVIALGGTIGLAFAVMASRAPRSVASPVLWVAYSWLGVVFLLFALLVASEIFRAGLVFLDKSPDPERRKFMARVFAAAVGAGGLGAAVLAAVEGSKLSVVRVPLTLKKFPKALSGYTIAQLSDIHIGPTLGRAFIDEIVEKTNHLSPDLIAITGDLVDGSVKDLGAMVEGLRHLRAKDGVYFVIGNHELYSGVEEWVAFLASLGIRTLRNERVAIRGAEGFDLAGVDDPQVARYRPSERMDVALAARGRDPSRALVLMAHQPKAIFDAARAAVDLQLSGHTHGGQIFPFRYFVKLDQPYVSGLHQHGETAIYVSQGTGYWGPPMRLAAPAEITQIVIQS